MTGVFLQRQPDPVIWVMQGPLEHSEGINNFFAFIIYTIYCEHAGVAHSDSALEVAQSATQNQMSSDPPEQ